MGDSNVDAQVANLQAQVADLTRRLLRLETIIRGDANDLVQIIGKEIAIIADTHAAIAGDTAGVIGRNHLKLFTQKELEIHAAKVTGSSAVSSTNADVKKLVRNQNYPIGQP